MNSRILLLLVSTATVAACARPTPPEAAPTLGTSESHVHVSTSVDAFTDTSVAEPTTKPPAPPPPPRTTTTTTTKPPPPPPPPERWALSNPNRVSASQVIGATLDSVDPFSLWAGFCPQQKLCVKIEYELLPGLDKAENGSITQVRIPDPLHEGGTVTYVFRPSDVEPEPTP